jgi:signal transduction histidine kinase
VTLREPVAGKPSAYVDGTASLAAVTRVANIVGLALLIVGLLLLPCAVVGGRWLVQRGLRPLDDLVRGVRTLDHSQLTERLSVDESAPLEVLALAREFDSLLTRVQGTIEGMRRFTADASHELRNPLAVLRAGLEVTLRRPRTLEEYERAARQTLSELERVQATVESLLALAHQAPGEEPEIDHRPVDVGELLQSVPAAFALPVADRGISFDVSVEPGLRVMGDATLLRLLLFNLLDNAVRHSPDGEVITIEAGSEENEVRLRVLDRGPGVSPEAREHIFRRSAGARTPEGRIGGLGLSFARWVAERHGGALTLDAVGGAGASFSLVLPAGFSRVPAVRSS